MAVEVAPTHFRVIYGVTHISHYAYPISHYPYQVSHYLCRSIPREWWGGDQNIV